MTRHQRIADLTTFAVPSQPAMSPGGREVVYVLTTVDAGAGKNVTSLWRATGDSARQLTRGTADSPPAWSPDGTTIAFLRIGDMTRSAKGTVASPGKNVAQEAGLNKAIQTSGWGTLNADVNAACNIAAGHAVKARGGDAVRQPLNREPQLMLV